MTVFESEKHIKNATIAALLSALVTLIFSLLPLIGTSLGGYNLWNLFDAAFIIGMAYGISRKSRTCAVLMLAYYVASKVLSIAEGRILFGILIGTIFTYYYFQGVRGTFTWHSLKKNEPNQPPAKPPTSATPPAGPEPRQP